MQEKFGLHCKVRQKLRTALSTSQPLRENMWKKVWFWRNERHKRLLTSSCETVLDTRYSTTSLTTVLSSFSFPCFSMFAKIVLIISNQIILSYWTAQTSFFNENSKSRFSTCVKLAFAVAKLMGLLVARQIVKQVRTAISRLRSCTLQAGLKTTARMAWDFSGIFKKLLKEESDLDYLQYNCLVCWLTDKRGTNCLKRSDFTEHLHDVYWGFISHRFVQILQKKETSQQNRNNRREK